MITRNDYASIGKRILATLLDGMVLAIPCFIGGQVIPIVGGILVYVLYVPVLECSELRATLGKYWMGLQVTDIQGRRISLQAGLIRTVVKMLSLPLFFIDCLFALFNERKQTLHDLLSDTVVIYGRAEMQVMDAWTESMRGIFTRYSASPTKRDTLVELERLQALKDKGTITEEEFQEQKRRILS